MSSISNLESLVSRLEAVATRLEAAAPGSAGASKSGAPAASASGSGESVAVKAFDEFISTTVGAFLAAAGVVGGSVQKQAEAAAAALKSQRNLIAIAAASKKPADADFPKLIQPIAEGIQQVQKLNDNRAKEKNHLQMVSNGIEALGWVAVSPAPAPFIGEMIPSAQTYGNKVLMEHRNVPGGEIHVTFVKSFYEVLQQLQSYVKQHQTTGLVWNPKGGDALSANVSSSSSSTPAAPAAAKPPAAAGGPPPPGPPPPPPKDFYKTDAPAAASSSSSGGMASVLADLSKGEGVTKGLRKVTDDMKAKNRTDRSGVVTEKSPAASSKEAAPTKPPKCALEMGGKKWVIENQVDNQSLELTDCSIQQAVYIYKCTGRTARTIVQIKQKVKIVSMDDCSKTSVVVPDVVASVDIVNCKRCEIQLNGFVPTITLDNVNGLLIYMTHPDSVKTKIVSSKCSEINVVLPTVAEGEASEVAIPEQYETVVVNGKLVTTPVSHVGV